MKRRVLSHLPLLLLLILALGMVGGCGTQIPSGHRGVFYSKFGAGTEFGRVYGEGFAWHLPWNSMFVYQIKLQERKEDLTVLSSDGATIKMEVSILYKPMMEKLDSLQVAIGPNYYNVSPYSNPQGPATGSYRSLRGGCWNVDWPRSRTAMREGHLVNTRSPHIGFRCAWSAGE